MPGTRGPRKPALGKARAHGGRAMRTWWQGRVVLAAAAALGSMGAGVSYHVARPGCLPGLPYHEYVYGTIVQPVTIFSLDAVPLDRTPPAGPGVPPGLVRARVKYFQLPL